MKKLVGFILAAAMASTVVACAKPTITPEPVSEVPVTQLPATQAPTPTPTPKKLITVGFAEVGAESGWRTAHCDSFKDFFKEANGFKLVFVDSMAFLFYSASLYEGQGAIVRNFIRQGVDYIVIAPITYTGWETVLQEAKDAGIPVIISAPTHELDVSDELYTTYIRSNFEKQGIDAVKWLEGYLAENGRSDEALNIVHLQGTDSIAQIGRTKPLNDAVAGPHAGKWTIVAQQIGEFTEAKGQEVMEDILKNTTDIQVIYSENDDMTYGAITALQNAGIDPKELIIISFDGNMRAIKMIIDGYIDCVAECNPRLGPQVGEIIKKLEAGETVPKITYTIEGVYDITNAEAHLPDAFGS